jgi:aldehyde dehydrogenase
MDQNVPFLYPGDEGSKLKPKSRYENFIGGDWKKPKSGQYFENISPTSGKVICEIPRSSHEDVDAALDAAHKAAPGWGKKGPAERANVLLKIADRIEENTEQLALAETLDNGKPIREGFAADIPLTVDHFRYFASAIRAQEGTIGNIDGMQSGGGNSAQGMMAYHYPEPLGVVGQIIPWNFPILMAAWKLAPAIAAGNAVVLKPAEQTPYSICALLEIIGDLLPPGVVNVVQGYGVEAGKPLASSNRIKKIGFTGETTTGKLIMQYASENLIPVTLELGGKSPNIFFKDIMNGTDEYISRCVEGFLHAYFNQGEVCTCPSRAIIHKDIYEPFMAMVKERVRAINCGNPFDLSTQLGAQASNEQFEKIMSYLDIGRQEGAKVLFGGEKREMQSPFSGGYYVEPTAFEGNNSMRIFQEEIFGPVVSVTTFEDEAEAVAIANDTLYGLGAGVWSRDANICYRMGRNIEAGRVWVNCYHSYPAHAAFGGYKNSGIGRETHKMMLNHYQQTKNVLVSYSEVPDGFF